MADEPKLDTVMISTMTGKQFQTQVERGQTLESLWGYISRTGGLYVTNEFNRNLFLPYHAIEVLQRKD